MGLRPTKVDEKRRVILSEAKDLLFSCTPGDIRDAAHVFRGSEARDLLSLAPSMTCEEHENSRFLASLGMTKLSE
jgi:hypothetical protein